MRTAGFIKGARVKLGDCEFTLIRQIIPGEWQLEATATGELRRMTQVAMLDELAEGTMTFVVEDEGKPGAAASFRKENALRQFDLLPVEHRQKAKLRRAIVTTLIKEFGESWPVRRIGARLAELWIANHQPPLPPPHPKSVWRWTRRYLASGKDIRSLLSFHHRCGNYTSRVHEEVDQIVRDAIDKIYLSTERGTYQDTLDHAITEVVRANRLKLTNAQLPIPTLTLVKRLVNAIPAFDRYAARYGRQAAERHYRTVLGKTVANAPLERVEIDHTRIDVFVVDEDTCLPLGRPWLTLCVDVRTRVILGFSVSFDPPSHATVARALKHAMLPKGAVSKTYPTVENTWDACGVMDGIVVDNGAEFHSESLEAACYSLGIDIQYCPRKQPWFKGIVERVQGSLNRGVAHGVPGTTFSSIVDRADYNAAKKATITLNTLKEIIHIWIIDYYHRRPHKGLGDTPAHAWKVETAGMNLRFPANPKELDAVLGKIASRRLTHKGIEINSLFYNSRDAGDLIRRLGTELEVTIRHSDDDLGHIYILVPDSNEYLLIPAVDHSYAKGLTLWQHKVCRRFARRELAGRTDTLALAEAKRRIRERVEHDFFRKGRKTRVADQRFLTGGPTSASMEAESSEMAPEGANVPSAATPSAPSVTHKTRPDQPVTLPSPTVRPSFSPLHVQRLPTLSNQFQQEA